jgi:hypothetical protein
MGDHASQSTESYAATRASLHGVAELLLAGPQRRSTRSIKLTVTDDGFATGPFPAEPWLIAVRGLSIAFGVGGERRVPLEGTYAEVAAKIGVIAEAPINSYAAASGKHPDDKLELDPAATATLLSALKIGDAACRAFAALHDSEDVPILWPEHFDVGITIGAVNYGVSPGDGAIAQPYAYVGPHEAQSGAFWNQPFGAARVVADFADAAGVVAFFEDGYRRVAR